MIRYILQRRWLPWHLLWLVAVAGCIWLGVWQFEAAVAPRPAGADTQVWRNFAYSLNWLVFAGVALWFWWRFMRDQRATELAAAQDAEPEAPRPAVEAQPGRPSDGQRFDPFAEPEPPAGDNQQHR